MGDPFMETLFNLGIGAIALYALILVLRGRNQQDAAETALATQLVALVAGSQEAVKAQTEAIKAQTEALNKSNGDLLILLTSQTANIVANTSAITQMTSRLQEDFMPGMTGMVTDHEQKMLAEFRPVVTQLSQVYFAVRTMQDVMEAQLAANTELKSSALQHWDKESQSLANLRLQTATLSTALDGTAARIEDVFTAVMTLVHPAEATVTVVASEEAVATEVVIMPPTSDAVSMSAPPARLVTHRIPDDLDKTKSTMGGSNNGNV